MFMLSFRSNYTLFSWEEKNNMPIYNEMFNEVKNTVQSDFYGCITIVALSHCLLFHFLWEIALLSQLQRHYIMSFSSSSVGSESTCSLMTPSMEFPDRISFRKRDFSEEGPSGRVKEKRKLMRNKLIENFRKPEDITSWLKGQLLGGGSFASVYEAISE